MIERTGAGAENGVERAQKPDERDESGAGAGLKKIRLSGSGSGTVSGLNRPLTIRSNLTIIDC